VVGCDVKATITEHWLGENFNRIGQSTGIRLWVEFYEAVKADDKVKRCTEFLFQSYSYIADLECSVNRARDMSSYSNRTKDITAYEQSSVIPYGITALPTTSTKFGVAARVLREISSVCTLFSTPC
jgi:hypothetical protein